MIYIKLEKEPETISELLSKFFIVWTGNVMNAVTTYSDKECTKIQCHQNKYRSFDDILELVQTYLPEATHKDVIHELLCLDLINPNNNKELYMYLSECKDIGRITIFGYDEYAIEEFTIRNKLTSKYSWKELLELLNINNNQELKEYCAKNRKINKKEQVEIL